MLKFTKKGDNMLRVVLCGTCIVYTEERYMYLHTRTRYSFTYKSYVILGSSYTTVWG